ncbi:MAG: tetratricopeptide repeat protein [Bacteroidota bacterium]
MRLSILSLSLAALFLGLQACKQQGDLYFRRSQSEVAPAAELAEMLVQGSFRHYQGSPSHQMVLQEALKLDPASALVHRELGVAYLKRGYANEFPRYYGQAAELDPVTWIGWRGYLYLYFYRDYRRAIGDFNALDTLTPDVVDQPQSQSVDYMRGVAFHQLGDYDHAHYFLQKHLDYEAEHGGRRYTSSVAYLIYAMNWRSLGNNNKALEALDLALSWGSRMADLHYYRAMILREEGRLVEARAALQKACQGYADDWYHERAYVEEFYQVYPEDFAALAEELNR